MMSDSVSHDDVRDLKNIIDDLEDEMKALKKTKLTHEDCTVLREARTMIQGEIDSLALERREFTQAKRLLRGLDKISAKCYR